MAGLDEKGEAPTVLISVVEPFKPLTTDRIAALTREEMARFGWILVFFRLTPRPTTGAWAHGWASLQWGGVRSVSPL